MIQPVTDRALRWWQTASRRSRWMAGLTAGSVVLTGVFFSLTGGSTVTVSGGADTAALDSPLFFMGAMFKLAGVLLLMVGLAVVFKRWYAGRGVTSATGRAMNVVQSLRLSPRQSLHLVRVGNETFLIGATDQSLALISPVELEPAPEAGEALPVASFQSVLSGWIGQAANHGD
jgi:flagellar biosynthetic protein FliO